MKRPHLLLFDIDGTLLITGGASSRCMKRACELTLGERFVWSKPTPGSTDPRLFTDLAAASGFDNAEAHQDAFRDCYLKLLEQDLVEHRADVKLLPGVVALLQELGERQHRGEVITGLLTGNYQRAAELKLQAVGLNPADFRIHAFAEHGPTRADLLVSALASYQRLINQPADPKRTWVIGDTPNDIACAHAHDCIAVAVATGWYDAAALTEAGADLVLSSFSQPGPLLEHLENQPNAADSR